MHPDTADSACIPSSGDTVISSDTVVNSDDDEIELNDISSDTRTETEFMDDEEHRATMMKLYHPKPKTNESGTTNNCNRYGYSEEDKSISPDLLRKSGTEPPHFQPPQSGHGLPLHNLQRDNLKDRDHDDSVSEPVHENQSEADYCLTDTVQAIDPLIRPHIVDQAGSDSRFSLRLSVLDAKGDNDTSRSDKFASGFLVDDHTQNTVSTHSKITVVDDEDDHGIESSVVDPSLVDDMNGNSKRSRSRKRSKKKKRSFTPHHTEYSHHSHSTKSKYREYRKKDPMDVVEAFTASNKEKQASFSVTISRTTPSQHSESANSRNNSFAHLNLKFGDGPPQLTPYGDDNEHERKLTEQFDSIAFSNMAAPITSPRKTFLQHRRGKSLEVQSTTNSEYNDPNYIGRPVPIIRRVVSVQNSNQTDKNEGDSNDVNSSSDGHPHRGVDHMANQEEEANVSRLYVPQPRYLSLSVSEYTDVSGTDPAGSSSTANDHRHLLSSVHHGIPGKISMNKSIQNSVNSAGCYPMSTATSNHFRTSTVAKPPSAPSIAVPQSRASKIEKQSSVEFGKESSKKANPSKEAFYFPSDSELSEAESGSFHRLRPHSTMYGATKKKPKLQRVQTDKTNKSYNTMERERGSRGSKKMNRKRSGSGGGGGGNGKTKRKTSKPSKSTKGKNGKSKTVRYSDENIEREEYGANTAKRDRQRQYKQLDLMRAQSCNPIGSSNSYHHHHHHHQQQQQQHQHNKHYYGNAPIHNYNHYVPPPPLKDYFTASSKVHQSESHQNRDKSHVLRPATVKFSDRQRGSSRNAPPNASSARFTFDTDVSDENEEYFDNSSDSNGMDDAVATTEDMDSAHYSEDDGISGVSAISAISDSQRKRLDGIINHFWRVIDIASNRKIPFEILKISLRVKNINIKENHWDILLNELTNFQPSKNITLRMFKDFIFDRKASNTRYYRNDSHIINALRKKLIAGLLGTDERSERSGHSGGHSERSKSGSKKASKPKLSNRYSKNASARSKLKLINNDYFHHDVDADDDDDDDDYYYENGDLDDDEEDEEESDGKIKTIKFNINPSATLKLKDNKSSSKRKPKARPLKHKRSHSGFSGFSETQSVDTLEHFGNKELSHFVSDGHRKRGQRERSSSHQSYLRSTTPRTVRSSSHESYANHSHYLKYSIQQSIVKSLLECYENSLLRKMSASRFMGYLKHSEWRKAMKYLLRCHFAYLSDNEDVFTLEQFKFALYDQCNIRYDFSHEILPILSLNTKSFQEYVITSHSYCEWMLKHLDNLSLVLIYICILNVTRYAHSEQITFDSERIFVFSLSLCPLIALFVCPFCT